MAKDYYITQYNVISGIPYAELVRCVRIQIGEDWHPIGGIAVDNGKFYQAMVKYPPLPIVKLPK